MSCVKLENGNNAIYNSVGRQLVGNPSAGLDGGLNPKELLESAIGLCLLLNMRAVLERDGLLADDTHIAIEVTGEKDPGGENRFTKYTVKAELPPEMDEAYKKKLLLLAERGCTISHTILSGAEIVSELA